MKKVVSNEQEQFPFDYIQREIKTVLKREPDIDEQLVFLAVMKELTRYKSNWEKQSVTFIQNYYFPLKEIQDIKYSLDFHEPYEVYCELIRVYYLLSNHHGNKIFHQILNWFPTKNKLHVFLDWPNDFVLSLFYPKIIKENIYFEDIKTKRKYPVADRDDLLLTSIKETYSPFLSLLLPTDRKFFTDMILPCEKFEPISLTSIDHLSEDNWEDYLLQWYRENLYRSCLSS